MNRTLLLAGTVSLTAIQVPAQAVAAAAQRSAARPNTDHPAPLKSVAAANIAATQEPKASGFTNAIQVYPFAEGSLYRLYASPGRVTDIALQPGEALVAVAAGDTARWIIGDTTSGSGEAERTHILVKPVSPGLATNLVITTDRRSYHLNLTSTSGAAMAGLSWTYPHDRLIALRNKASRAKAAAPVAAGLALEQLHFNYRISGDDPAWRPLRAFDDGRQTFIEFPKSIVVGEAPPLFLVDESGETALVNYRMRGRFYVVDRIFHVAELRLGTKNQKVVKITRITENPGQRVDS
jgi:P-type conjugative transfer protein TrbG